MLFFLSRGLIVDKTKDAELYQPSEKLTIGHQIKMHQRATNYLKKVCKRAELLFLNQTRQQNQTI